MLQKFGKRVMNNFGLKILAVLFAVVLWIVVVNIDDPSNSKPYTTSVSLENKSYIDVYKRQSLLCSEIPVENGNEYNAEEDTGRKHTDFACG